MYWGINMSVIFYNLTQKVMVSFVENGTSNSNMPMNNTDFKIYRNSPIDVEFNIKNSDRKPVNLSGKTVNITMIDSTTGKALLNRNLTTIDPVKGKAVLHILPNDTNTWEYGFQKYSLTLIDSEGKNTLLYLSEQFNARGYFEVVESLHPQPKSSILIETKDFVPENWNQYETTYYVSQVYPGAVQESINKLHTLALYGDHYKGKFMVQGSLDNIPSFDPNEWFDIKLTQDSNYAYFNDFTGLEAYSFSASAMWIRFVYEPTFDNRGKLIKILYKN